jgi:hypothetical protein
MHASKNSDAMAKDSDFTLRRLGPPPHANGHQTISLNGCPDFFEGSDRNFYFIGIDRTEDMRGKLPPDAGCGPDERIILVPRRTVVLAKPHIPDVI